jgi:nucleotide-binding universal stress UspA family protein
MSYRSILVHLDDTDAGERRVRAGAELARRFGGGLVGIYFMPPAPLEMELLELPPAAVSVRMSQREARARVDAAFRAEAARAGVKPVEFRVLEGDPLEQAIAEMRCADLSILAQGDLETGHGGFERRLAEQAVLANGAPVLFLPYAQATATLGETVVVAWDGGREAARAVRDALPLLAEAKRVTVLSLGHRVGLGERPDRSQARLASYLRAHDIAAEQREMVCAPAEAGDLVLSQLADLGADLLVMGAYGHARVREIILGGVTRILLDSMTVPVLMSH